MTTIMSRTVLVTWTTMIKWITRTNMNPFRDYKNYQKILEIEPFRLHKKSLINVLVERKYVVKKT